MAAKAEFYDSYVGAVKALSAERVKKILDTIKKGKVALMNTDCYAIKSDTIYEIIGKSSPQNSSYFAILYMGWPLDSQANPLCVKAVFKAIHGTTSTSGGVIVPCSVIDTHGLQVQVTKESFDQAEPPKKYGRQEEQAEHPDTQKTPASRTPKTHQSPKGSVGTKRRRSTARAAKPQESEENDSMSVGTSDADPEDDGHDESEEEDPALTIEQFDDIQHRIRMQLFGEDGQGVNIGEHEKLMNAYTKLESKCDRLKKQVDEERATAETLRGELEAWGRIKKVWNETIPSDKMLGR